MEDKTQYSRYLCPNLHQCFIYEDKVCDVCDEPLEFIGMMNEKELEIYLGKKQLEKFYVKNT
jgi:hypothetical protein